MTIVCPVEARVGSGDAAGFYVTITVKSGRLHYDAASRPAFNHSTRLTAPKASADDAMKVLMVNPEFPDTYWSFRHALPFERKSCAFPPLGLLTVSSLLPKSWERRLVDLNVRSIKDSEIEWADMVFVTGMLVQKDSLHEVVSKCKAMGKRVVLGGPYVTTTVEDLPHADHIFIGEAETTLPEFVADLESDRKSTRLNSSHGYISYAVFCL